MVLTLIHSLPEILDEFNAVSLSKPQIQKQQIRLRFYDSFEGGAKIERYDALVLGDQDTPRASACDAGVRIVELGCRRGGEGRLCSHATPQSGRERAQVKGDWGIFCHLSRQFRLLGRAPFGGRGVRPYWARPTHGLQHG